MIWIYFFLRDTFFCESEEITCQVVNYTNLNKFKKTLQHIDMYN